MSDRSAMLARSGSGRRGADELGEDSDEAYRDWGEDSCSRGRGGSGSSVGEVPDLRAGDLSAPGLLGSQMRNRMGEEMSEGYVVIGIRGVDYLLTIQEAEKTLLELQAGLYEADKGVGA